MPVLGKMLGEIKAKKIGEGFYSFQLNQPPELAEKVHSVGARIKAGEKITPPNKKLLGLWYVCPQCGQRVKRQIFRQVMITVGGVTTFAYYECACGWQYATTIRMYSMFSGRVLPPPYPW